MKNKISFFEILILVWSILLPTTMSTLIVIVYLKEIDKITFIDNTLMKIAFVVSVLHLVIMLGIVINSIINDIKEIRKARFYLKHPEEREKDKHFEELNKFLEEKEKNGNEKTKH